jgi:hydrogenase/urease accessory protein HupE
MMPELPASREASLRPKSWRRVTVWLALLWAAAARLSAHDPGISTAQVQLHADRLEIVTGFAPDDAQFLLPAALRTAEKWTEADFGRVQPALAADAARLWEVRAGGATLRPRSARVELLPDDNVSFFLTYAPVAAGAGLGLHAPRLAELPPEHRQFAIVTDVLGSMLGRKLLRSADATLDLPGSGAAPAANAPAPADESAGATFRGFLKLGVEHIWTGYDHLLFLFALLVVCRTFRASVAIISCFTLAHSITLGLATFDLVNLPAALVEPVIAASIVYVGVENLLRRGEEPRGRWLLTFAFGLIHGFGFAGVLRDLGLGEASGGIAVPLLAFNLGVELGQIAIAVVVLPLVWRARRNEKFVRRAVPALSAAVALAGLYWLLERTVFR